MPKEITVRRLPFSGYTGDNRFEVVKSDGGSSEYYDLPPDCKTLQDVIWQKDMNWNQANIFKAAYRWDIKPDAAYNLRKIIYFAEDALRRLEEQYERGHESNGEDSGT